MTWTRTPYTIHRNASDLLTFLVRDTVSQAFKWNFRLNDFLGNPFSEWNFHRMWGTPHMAHQWVNDSKWHKIKFRISHVRHTAAMNESETKKWNRSSHLRYHPKHNEDKKWKSWKKTALILQFVIGRWHAHTLQKRIRFLPSPNTVHFIHHFIA